MNSFDKKKAITVLTIWGNNSTKVHVMQVAITVNINVFLFF